MWHEEQRIGKMFWGGTVGGDSWFRGLREKGLTFTLSPISWVTLHRSSNCSRPRGFLLLSGKVFLVRIKSPSFLKNDLCLKYSVLSGSREKESRDLIQSDVYPVWETEVTPSQRAPLRITRPTWPLLLFLTSFLSDTTTEESAQIQCAYFQLLQPPHFRDEENKNQRCRGHTVTGKART